jgi:hypothetical protein
VFERRVRAGLTKMASLGQGEFHIVIIDGKGACPTLPARLHDVKEREVDIFVLIFCFFFIKKKEK